MCAVARFQPAGAEWTVLVSHQLIAARLVIIRLGASDPLHWELLQALHSRANQASRNLSRHAKKPEGRVLVRVTPAEDGFGLSLPEFVSGIPSLPSTRLEGPPPSIDGSVRSNWLDRQVEAARTLCARARLPRARRRVEAHCLSRYTASCGCFLFRCLRCSLRFSS